EWTPTPANKAITQAGEKAEENKPKVDTPALPDFGSKIYGSGKNKAKGNKGTESVEAAGHAAAQTDPNKLGDIVFKNRPPVIPIEGVYQEPRLQQPSLLSRLTDKLQPILPTLSGIPVPVTPARAGNGNKQDDRYIINLHFHGVDMQNSRSISEMVKTE
ncbi:hypothetical protein ACR71G_23615, partial [Xenorhabdus bovienii]